MEDASNIASIRWYIDLETWTSELPEFLINTERKESKITQNILLDGYYLLFEEYGREKKLLLYLETVPKKRPKFRRKSTE